jgi:hypothetical protein
MRGPRGSARVWRDGAIGPGSTSKKPAASCREHSIAVIAGAIRHRRRGPSLPCEEQVRSLTVLLVDETTEKGRYW